MTLRPKWHTLATTKLGQKRRSFEKMALTICQTFFCSGGAYVQVHLIASVHCKAIFLTQRFWEIVHFYGFAISFMRKVDRGRDGRRGAF